MVVCPGTLCAPGCSQFSKLAGAAHSVFERLDAAIELGDLIGAGRVIQTACDLPNFLTGRFHRKIATSSSWHAALPSIYGLTANVVQAIIEAIENQQRL